MKVVNTFHKEGYGENDVVSRDREYNLSLSAHIHVHTFFFPMGCPSQSVNR